MANRVNRVFVLLEIDWIVFDGDAGEIVDSRVLRYSTGKTVTVGGNTYLPLIKSVDGLDSIYIDRTEKSFGGASFTLTNISSTAIGPGTKGPFHILNEQDDFEDKAVRVYLYNEADGALEDPIWHGILKRPQFDNKNRRVTLEASYPLEAIAQPFPSLKFNGQRCTVGFGGDPWERRPGGPHDGCPYPTGSLGLRGGDPESCDHFFNTPNGCVAHGMERYFPAWLKVAPILNGERNNLVERDKIRDATVPLIYSSQRSKFRPEIIQSKIRDGRLYTTFVISGTHPGGAFSAGDLTADKVKLYGSQKAVELVFLTGASPQDAPSNTTMFPEYGEFEGVKYYPGHSHVSMACAIFELTKEQQKELDNLGIHAVKITLEQGRRTKRSGFANSTGNPHYALEDMLVDQIYSIGWPSSEIEVPDAAYMGGRYDVRLEIDEQYNLPDFLQEYLGVYHSFITMNGSKLQIGAKRHDEEGQPGIKTFGGPGGRKIIDNDHVDWSEADSAELLNEITGEMRTYLRDWRGLVYFDKDAQRKAGNGIKKKVEDTLFLHGIADETEGLIALACMMREEQNLNGWITFRTPVMDGRDVLAGEIIRVNSNDIPNNGSNKFFRVTGRTLIYNDTTRYFEIKARIHKDIVYAPNADPIHGDVIRNGGDGNYYTRPPDVINLTAALVDKDPTGDGGVLATIEAGFEYPPIDQDDLDDTLASGIKMQGVPWSGVDIFYRYTSEPQNVFHFGTNVQYPENVARFECDFHKNKDLQVVYVAKAQNNGRSELGFVLDRASLRTLPEDLSAGDTSITFASLPAGWVVDAILKLESEFVKITNVAGTTITIARGAIKSEAASHEKGEEIGLAKLNYPSVTLDFNNSVRKTLGKVLNVTLEDRRDGTLITWNDLDKDELENYWLYASASPTALAGSTTPAWYVADPHTPPANVFVFKGKRLREKISNKKIDSWKSALGLTDRTIYVRVAGKLRDTWSSELSDLGTGKHTAGPSSPPATPLVGDIFTERIGDSDRATVEITLYPVADRTSTAASNGTEFMDCRLEKWVKATSSWKPVNIRPKYFESPDTDTSIKIDRDFPYGQRMRLVRAIGGNDAGRVKSPDVNIEFRAGIQQDDLTGVSVAIIAHTDVDMNGDRDTQLTTRIVNSTPAAAIRKIEFFFRKGGVSTWRDGPEKRLLGISGLTVAGATTDLYNTLHHPSADKAPTIEVFARVHSTDGSTKDSAIYTFTPGTSGTGAVFDPIPTDGSGPSYPTTGHHTKNTSVGDPGSLMATLILTPYAKGDGTKTFAEQNILTVTTALALSGEQGDVTKWIHKTVTPDPGALYAKAKYDVTLGATYYWVDTTFSNPEYSVPRSGGTSAPFIGGEDSYLFNANSLGSPSLVRTALAGSNKKSRLTLTFTQTTPKPTALKEAILESQNSDGIWDEERTRDLSKEAAKFWVTGGKTIRFKVSHEPGATYAWRILLIPVGSTRDSANTLVITSAGATFAGDSAGGVPGTSAAPVPDIDKSTIGRFGLVIEASVPDPASGPSYVFSHYEFQFNSNGAFTGTYMNPRTGGTSLSTTWYRSSVGSYYSDIRKRDLNAIFGGTRGANISLFVRVRAVVLDSSGNKVTGTASGGIAVLHVTGVDEIPSSTTAFSDRNVIVGSGFYHSRANYGVSGGTATQLGRNWRTAVNGADTTIITTTAGANGLFWWQGAHCLEFTTSYPGGSVAACTRLVDQFNAGERWTLTILLRCAGAFTPGSILFELVDSGSSATIGSNTLSPGAITTNWFMWTIPLTVNTAAQSGNTWLRIKPPATPAFALDFDNLMLVRGNVGMMWAPSPKDDDADTGVNRNSNNGVGNIGAASGTGNDGLWGSAGRMFPDA